MGDAIKPRLFALELLCCATALPEWKGFLEIGCLNETKQALISDQNKCTVNYKVHVLHNLGNTAISVKVSAACILKQSDRLLITNHHFH